ncbi:FAD-binding domain-containing protein [Annulohypoxylon maeteangense]|uniref:FAD-binding domain-containing protein n=1 Tax=Annulohypoxylon maeteangense TaxID=1927788 RepID=UPI002008046D|nr:FAD-binding domain-containing protein [Annulohypoxylon maeteangense]KAI0888224.1 FAD-binding domain-containing protein [Annulohypoxylon maeteangense]
MILKLALFPLTLALLALVDASSAQTSKSTPIVLLKEKGIASDLLSETSSGLKFGHGCFCSLACDTLTTILGKDRSDIIGQESYETTRSKFWSLQQSKETSPRCFAHPINAEEVSIIVLLSRATNCPFAVKGGGHAAFKGASNSDGGITIDFDRMKHVIPNADTKSVAIGPGNTWLDVYTVLEKFNLTMAGGRTATVGVSGLTLGGGLSFFSGLYGMTCDNIINYEIVLGSGEIITVDSKTNADLFWALRGGGGNFGVVTQFVASTFKQGPMWGGTVAWEMHSTKATLIDALVSYAENGSQEDPNSALIVSFAYIQNYQAWLSVVMAHHSDPQPSGSHPKVFDDFMSIENEVQGSKRNAFHSNFTVEIDDASPPGLRESYWTLTTHVDKQLTLDLLAIFEEEIIPIQNLTEFLPAFVYQVVTVPQLKAMTRNGGNALGIDGSEKPLFLINYSARWKFDSDDALVLTAMSNILSRSRELARARGLDHPFLYMNYASQFQDPLGSYGTENKARLMRISRKYDPDGVFEALSPGYFKFNGAPAQF